VAVVAMLAKLPLLPHSLVTANPLARQSPIPTAVSISLKVLAIAFYICGTIPTAVETTKKALIQLLPDV
jgi:hypothetical protein